MSSTATASLAVVAPAAISSRLTGPPTPATAAGRAVGVWSADEHDRFLEALKKFPQGPWKAITEFIGTRSVRQVQTHAQKYQEKVSRRLHGLQTGKAVRLRREHRIDHDVLGLRTLISMPGKKHARRALDPKQGSPKLAAKPPVTVKVEEPTNGTAEPAAIGQRPTLDKVEPDAMIAAMDLEGSSPSAISSTTIFEGYDFADFAMLDVEDLPTLSESLDFFIENFSST